MSAGDPVSWFMIEPGWKVADEQDQEVGRVEEVAGDTSADLFSGLSISTGLLSGARYVPAEEVTEITEGRVRLGLSKDEVKSLSRHEGAPTSEQVLPPDRAR